MLKRNIFISIILIVTWQSILAQNQSIDSIQGSPQYKRIIFKAGYAYQELNSLELGVLRRNIQNLRSTPLSISGITGSLEIGLNEFLIAAKFGYEGHYKFLGTRALMAYYTDFTNTLPMISTEVGFSLNGRFFVAQGYNTFLKKDSNFNISKLRLSITIYFKRRK